MLHLIVLTCLIVIVKGQTGALDLKSYTIPPASVNFNSPWIGVVTASQTSTGRNTLLANYKGTAVYQDRTYEHILGAFPQFLLQAVYARLFNDDKLVSTSGTYVSFIFTTPMQVYVAYDSRATSLPGWMSGWTYVGQSQRQDTDAPLTMNLYTNFKAYLNISLGSPFASPAAGANSQYIPYFVPADVECTQIHFTDHFDRPDGAVGPKYQNGGVYQLNAWHLVSGRMTTTGDTSFYDSGITALAYHVNEYTIQTKALNWEGIQANKPSFLFGIPEEWAQQTKNNPTYRLTYHSAAARLILTFESVVSLSNLTVTSLVVANVSYVKPAGWSTIRITREVSGSLKIFVGDFYSVPAVPIISVTNTITELGKFGWTNPANSGQTLQIEYLHARGRRCSPGIGF